MSVVFRCLALLLGGILLSSPPMLAGEGVTDIPSVNPSRGKSALAQKRCIACHSIWGVGGKLGPDLAAAGSDQSFQQMASMFWNHTPRMVQLLRQRGMEWPTLSEQEMADISSFIYYLKLLDRPGDVSRGRILYQEKKCESCHSLNAPGKAGQIPLRRYGSFVSPVPLAQAMWNAGAAMRKEQQARGIVMPLFNGREMADLQAYIREKSAYSASDTTYVLLPDLSRGNTLFHSKGCSHCHTPTGRGGKVGPDLSMQPLRKPISEICGILWNHSFAMQAKMTALGIAFPRLEGNDLTDILVYIYFLHFSRDRGDPARGEMIFNGKGCANCHASEGSKDKRGPSLAATKEKYTMLRLATAMWNHAPIMYETMESEVMKWIKLDPDDMQDLSRYLQSISSGK